MLTYGDAERVLARLCNASLTATTTFRARLKQLKKLGIPVGINPGRGKKILYHKSEIYQWALCLEFMQFGIDPSVICGWIEADWMKFFKWMEASELHRGDRKRDIFLCFEPQFVSAASGDSTKQLEAISLLARSAAIDRIKNPHVARAGLINISEAVRVLDASTREICGKPLLPRRIKE